MRRESRNKLCPTSKKRRWVQIHLSTAIAAMLVSGALLWANVRERTDDWAYEYDAYTHHGFPADAFITYDYKDLFIPVDQRVRYGFVSAQIRDRTCWDLWTPYQSVIVLPFGMVINVLVAFIVVTVAVFLCELFIRRSDIRTRNSGPASAAVDVPTR